MVENLKTTKYRNGEPIANVTDDTEWAALATSAFCWYMNDAATSKPSLGALYNWYAIADSRNIAPTCWHVPSDAEWTTLTTYLGGGSIAGGKLKEVGNSHWNAPNDGATNSTGFTALPGGARECEYVPGFFQDQGNFGCWWSSTALSNLYANYRYLRCNYSIFFSGNKPMMNGFSVRCVRD
jgi:uncharacterized protein (TIGR02145 family)